MSGEPEGDDDDEEDCPLPVVGALRIPLWPDEAGEDALGEASILYGPDPAERSAQVRAAGLGHLLRFIEPPKGARPDAATVKLFRESNDIPEGARHDAVAAALSVPCCDFASDDEREVLAAHVLAFCELMAFLDGLGDVDAVRHMTDEGRASLRASRETTLVKLGALLAGRRSWEGRVEQRAIAKMRMDRNLRTDGGGAFADRNARRKANAARWRAEARAIA